MKDKLVSILIPVYNRENLIEETIQSALNQTYENIEIIVVDNQSTDNTWEILQKLASQDDKIKIFQNKINIGPVRNWKRCIDEARGEYGKILWSDDLIAPEFLEKTVPYLEDYNVGFVFTKIEIFYANSEKKLTTCDIGPTGLYKALDYIENVLEIGNYPVSPGCALFRLIDLKNNLIINIDNKIYSDFSMHAIGNDLLIFLLTANQYQSFAFINAKLSFFRVHNESLSTVSVMKLSLLYALVKASFYEKTNTTKVVFSRYNAYLNLLLIKYRNNSLNINEIQDFYLFNKNYTMNTKYFFYLLLIKAKLKLKYKINKLFGK